MTAKKMASDHEESIEDEGDIIDDMEDNMDEEDDEDDNEDSGKARNPTKLKRPPKFNVEKNNRTVFVGNLPKTMTSRTIRKLFRDCGDIESVRIRSVAPDKKKLSKKVASITKQIHGRIASFNAYVVFKTNPNDVPMKNALAKNGQLVEEHHIRVDRASKPKSQKHKVKVSRKKSVFVGNLPFDAKDDEVYTYFEKCGPIDGVRIVRDQVTGLGKGFGFVCFKDRATVNDALQLDQHRFRNRALRVTKVMDETSLSNNGQEPATKKATKHKPRKLVGLKGLMHTKQKHSNRQWKQPQPNNSNKKFNEIN